ncbi:uncharacterized protein LOC127252377 [Andrographis paniculata]|uniref:uncharacterized protein LOC127252377 n=1 Tax=Andrographis paniculata TaxID=175694 RepID=UPI0021E7F027|nr:uncharacterized protein LOC127252377 [Andrographis paniculata]
MGLENTIARDKNSPSQDRAKAMIFLCHHIDEALKMQYVTLESPLELLERLKEIYDHLRLTLLPRARSEWQSLRLQDFKTVQEYNSAMFKITSQLRYCGENQQYRERGFQKYSELITCLLLAEQNNELLLKNHESRPTGANPFPEANAIQPANPVRGRGQVRNQRIDRDRNQNRGRGRANAYSHNNYQNRPRYMPNRRYNDRRPYRPQQRFNTGRNRNNDDECTRCGIKSHWAHLRKSYIAATNALAKINIPEGKVPSANEHTARVKRGRPLGSKDKNPRKKKIVNTGEEINNDQIPEKGSLDNDVYMKIP